MDIIWNFFILFADLFKALGIIDILDRDIYSLSDHKQQKLFS
jgi:hypothetical protein